MNFSQTGNESFLRIDALHNKDKLCELVGDSLERFCTIARRYIYFHLAMGALVIIELTLFFCFFFSLIQSAILALAIAALFLTCLSYFILRLYLQGRQTELFEGLTAEYIQGCRQLISHPEGVPKHHLAIANSCWKLATAISGQEYRFYFPSLRWKLARQAMMWLSCWCHWEDIYRFKELLLLQAIREHVALVKHAPTSLEVHAALANAYVILSELYSEIITKKESDGGVGHPTAIQREELTSKFRCTAQYAMEELKILKEYAPNDPWIHAQLAYSYHDLQMPDQEIKEYETLLRFNNQDKSVLAKLGALYFSQGRKAEGLRIYEALQQLDPLHAEQLIKHYDLAFHKKFPC